MIDQIGGFTTATAGTWNDEPDRFDYRFSMADGVLVDVLWRANEANETINFAVEPGRAVSWVSRDGVVTPLTPVGGYVSFTINGTPGYLRQEQAPVLALSTNLVRWITLPGENPLPQLVYLTNEGGGTLNWTATLLSGSAYFTVEPTSGTAPATLTIRATAPLTYGYFTGQIYIDGGAGGAASIWLGLTTAVEIWKIHLPLVWVSR
jgi:hypothetical protein